MLGRGKGKQKKKSDDEACVAQEDYDSDLVLLMATTCENLAQSKYWFLEIGCSNHMTNHKEWLSDLDTTRTSKVQFPDDRTLSAKGIGNIVLKGKNGKSTLIENVLYVPRKKCNLLSIGKLIKKGFSLIMKHDSMEIFDSSHRLILKAHLAKKVFFKST